MKMWSGRFEAGPDPEFDHWQRSFPYDKRLLPQEIAASRVYAQALQRVGVLDSVELKRMLSALDQILAEGVPEIDDPSIEDVHHYVEARLIASLGELGRKLHSGRSRNEQIATDLRLYVRDQIDSISVLCANLIEAILDQAVKAGDSAMPSYTHLQRAEPVLVAHWLLAYSEMLFRDIERLKDCRRRVNVCPLGSGAIAGTVLPLDREFIASELGFEAPSANSMDATSDRDFAIEFVQCLSVLAGHLSRWAEELILFTTQEYRFASLSEQYSTGSSAMPQKKNPDALELIRGKSAGILVCAMNLQVVVKGLPLAYNKDLQETQQPIFAAAEQASAMLRVAAGVMRSTKFEYDRMQQAATTGFMNAMAAAGHLVSKGVAFRTAHEQIGAAVRACIANDCELQHLSAEEFAAVGITADSSFYKALMLDSVLDCHNVPGGTAREQVKKSLESARERLSAMMGAAHVCA